MAPVQVWARLLDAGEWLEVALTIYRSRGHSCLGATVAVKTRHGVTCPQLGRGVSRVSDVLKRRCEAVSGRPGLFVLDLSHTV